MNVLDPEFLESLMSDVSMPYWYDDTHILRRASALYRDGFVLNLHNVEFEIDLHPFVATYETENRRDTQWGRIDTDCEADSFDVTEADAALSLRRLGLNLSVKAAVASVARPRLVGERRKTGLLLDISCFFIDTIEQRGRGASKRYENVDDEDYDHAMLMLDLDILANAFYAIFPRRY